MPSDAGFSIDPDTLISAAVVLATLLIVYFFLIRALVEMIRLDAPGVVIVFTYISLIPFPLVPDPRNSQFDHLAFCPKGHDGEAGPRNLNGRGGTFHALDRRLS